MLRLLQTVFRLLDFSDELSFTLRDDGQVRLVTPVNGIPEDQDLCVRAAKLLQHESGTTMGVDIALKKRIPMGGGLGGGSSDAATTLHALNRLWELGLSADQLAEIGLSLGADVPVFVHGFAAFAEGVGERLEPIELDEPWFLVITPDVHVSTAEIFSDTELTRDCPAIKICDLSTNGWGNVCVPVVVKRYPEVGKALNLLGKYSDSRMSGTGASVFTRFDSQQEAENALQKLQQEADWSANWQHFICRGRNKSPLHELMSSP